MTELELMEVIRNGEGSGVEFKRDDLREDALAKEMSAMLNFKGGRIFLGVEDDGEITGLTRDQEGAELWVRDIARNHVQPALIPHWECVTIDRGAVVGVIGIPDSCPDKPYKARHRGGTWVIYVRTGTTSRVASRTEEVRLYQSAQLVHYDKKVLYGSSIADLDALRVTDYLCRVQRREVFESSCNPAMLRVLRNIDLVGEYQGEFVPTVAGMLLFGKNPNRWLPQAGITAAAFRGNEKDYDIVDRDFIRGPLVSRSGETGAIIEPGVIDRAVEFVRRNMGSTAWLEAGRRHQRGALPLDAIRESVVNAVAHRDYTFEGTDVEISLYMDRVEVISPGSLPNGITVEMMKGGAHAARNGLLTGILRDYGYGEPPDSGVRNRIIGSMMEHNGKEPELIDDEIRFVVRLWK